MSDGCVICGDEPFAGLWVEDPGEGWDGEIAVCIDHYERIRDADGVL